MLIRPSSLLYEFQLECSTPEGAVLVLPNGASRTDLSSSFRPLLLAHARKHASSWLEWVYGSLELASSSLYLVTGYDECDNWCLASYSNVGAEMGVSLSFVPVVHADGIVWYAAPSSGDIAKRTCQPNGQVPRNQTGFIRGYKISTWRTLQERLRQGAVKIMDIVPQTENSSTPAYGGVPVATVLNQFLSRLNNFAFGGDRRGNRRSNNSDQQTIGPLDEHILQIESFPGPPEVIISSPR